jgi:dTDP-4-dehydrorhamnose reductase
MSFSSFELLDPGQAILVFGKDGQVGRALQSCLKDFHAQVIFVGRRECNLSNPNAIREILNRYQPHIIINAAAYTAVDKAETEPDLAHAINAEAPAIMADYIARIAHGIFVHYSTDYVYSGDKSSPYVELDNTGPLGQYGKSKLAGEQAIIKVFEALTKTLSDNKHQEVEKIEKLNQLKSRYYILRTSWVYGEGSNFIRTMLKLAAERDQLKVIADQHGVPTSADWLAQLAIELTGSKIDSGIYHAVPDGETTWHGLAMFAIEVARLLGEGVQVKPEAILAIPATEYPLPAPRPYNSRMNNSRLKKALSGMAYTNTYPKWQDQVEGYVKNYVENSLKS